MIRCVIDLLLYRDVTELIQALRSQLNNAIALLLAQLSPKEFRSHLMENESELEYDSMNYNLELI